MGVETQWFWYIFISWCLMCLLRIDPQCILVFVSACVGRYQLMRFIRWLSRITFFISLLRHELSALSAPPLPAHWLPALPGSDFTQWDGWHQSHNPKEKLILLSLSSIGGETGFGYLSKPRQLSFVAWLQYVQWFSVTTSSVSHIAISQQALAWSPVRCRISVKLNRINLLIPTLLSPWVGTALKLNRVCMLLKLIWLLLHLKSEEHTLQLHLVPVFHSHYDPVSQNTPWSSLTCVLFGLNLHVTVQVIFCLVQITILNSDFSRFTLKC